MRLLMLTQITRIRTCEAAEATLVPLFLAVQGGDVRVELCVGGGGVAALGTHIGSVAGVGALVVVFCLVGCEGFGAGGESAGVGAVAGVAEEVAGELGALLEVFGV